MLYDYVDLIEPAILYPNFIKKKIIRNYCDKYFQTARIDFMKYYVDHSADIYKLKINKNITEKEKQEYYRLSNLILVYFDCLLKHKKEDFISAKRFIDNYNLFNDLITEWYIYRNKLINTYFSH